MRAACPDAQAVAASVPRARTRQAAAFQATQGHLPADVCALEGAPGGGRQVVPAAADQQLCTLTRCPDDPAHYGVLTVRLPVRPDPRTRADWHPTLIRFRLSPTISLAAALHAPTLRVRGGRLWLDVAFTAAAPTISRNGHTRAVAFDCGWNTPLTGGTLPLTVGSSRPCSRHITGTAIQAAEILSPGSEPGRQPSRTQENLSSSATLTGVSALASRV